MENLLTSPQTWWWLLSVVLILVGVAGTILPALPGTFLVLAGIYLGAWIDDFQRVGAWSLAIITVLAILAWVSDFLSTVLGAKKAGASGLAMLGAAVGTVLGIFTGLVGLIFMPLLGAIVGELIARRDALHAGRVGLATWIGLIVGTLVKLVLTFMMIGVFVFALIV
ncbi:DUF456 family protein [Niveibacterium sp. SC-1]|uniref:DUF456 domain-containing protein n=1 Tax=Niveibacterium sp. SC-1 TaxID=3135646 RepID=UPI00311E19E5